MRTLCPQPTYDKAKSVQIILLYWGYVIYVLQYRQLYEQLRMKKATSIEMASILGLYVKRWQRWVAAGLQGFKIDVYEQIRHQQFPIQT
jgi:hypothetical protein